jgi:hypothetical protein
MKMDADSLIGIKLMNYEASQECEMSGSEYLGG